MQEETHICAYCGAPATHLLKNGKWCCHERWNSCPVIRKRNSAGLKNAYRVGARLSAMLGKKAWNKGLTVETSEIVKRIADKHKGIHIPGHPHTEEFKQKQRQNALNRGLGGFHMRRGIDYNGTKLDSTYEVEVAKSLDEHNIKWSRPKRFPYHMDGVLKHYTPDFYLPDYDVYLDPKNDFLINNVNPRLGIRDTDKIEQVQRENGIRILILDKAHLTWDAIKSLLPV